MRRALLVLAVSCAAAPAAARELYMGMSAGPSPAVDGRFGAHFRADGHVALGFVFGGELGGVDLAVIIAGAGYEAASAPAPADAALLLFGVDVGRRIVLAPRLAVAAGLGLHVAQVLRMTDEDMIPEALRFSGWGWSYGAQAIYTLGRLRSRAPPSNPIRFLDAALVLEARRERLFLENDGGAELRGAATLVTLGLRFGAEL